ncbi:MAG: hypothetical protein ABIA63_02445, partial [bacterium]
DFDGTIDRPPYFDGDRMLIENLLNITNEVKFKEGATGGRMEYVDKSTLRPEIDPVSQDKAYTIKNQNNSEVYVFIGLSENSKVLFMEDGKPVVTTWNGFGNSGISCPAQMVEVPGDGYCIDIYEFPNVGSAQQSIRNISFIDAKDSCEIQGKRLCDTWEWNNACEHTRPGGQLDPTKAADPRAYDMYGDLSGNFDEWCEETVTISTPKMGNSDNCGTTAHSGLARSDISFRCCKVPGGI